MKNKVIKSTFYKNGNAIFVAEWYEPLNNSEIEKRIEMMQAMGYEMPDALTDTAGRMIHLPLPKGVQSEKR